MLSGRIFGNFRNDFGVRGKVVLAIVTDMGLKVGDEVDWGCKDTCWMLIVFEAGWKLLLPDGLFFNRGRVTHGAQV